MKDLQEIMQRLETKGGDINARARLRCSLACELEDAGHYEQACEVMSPYWPRLGDQPHVNGLDALSRAEVLLRVGSLTDRVGSTRQFPAASALAKDLLSESLAVFEILGAVELQAEAMVDLAICYWREGGIDEARVMLESTLGLLEDREEGLQKARAIYNLSLVAWSLGHHREALNYLINEGPLFARVAGHALQGRFHNQLGLELRNVGTEEVRPDYLDRALIEFEAASFHFEQTNNSRFIADVQNNIGELCITLKRFDDARKHIERARRIAADLKDLFHTAEFDDTLARLHLAEANAAEAAQVAKKAAVALTGGSEQALLVKVRTTYGVALARLLQYEQSFTVLDQARGIARQIGDQAAAANVELTMIEELGEYLQPARLLSIYNQLQGALAVNCERVTLERLSHCAGLVIKSISAEVGYDAEGGPATLEQKLRRHEAGLVRQALEAAGGHITIAAKSLGISHQMLAFMLETRHKELYEKRIPPRVRHRSLIGKTRPKRVRRAKP